MNVPVVKGVCLKLKTVVDREVSVYEFFSFV